MTLKDWFDAEVVILLKKQDIMSARGEDEAVIAYFDGILALQRLYNKAVKEMKDDEV